MSRLELSPMYSSSAVSVQQAPLPTEHQRDSSATRILAASGASYSPSSSRWGSSSLLSSSQRISPPSAPHGHLRLLAPLLLVRWDGPVAERWDVWRQLRLVGLEIVNMLALISDGSLLEDSIPSLKAVTIFVVLRPLAVCKESKVLMLGKPKKADMQRLRKMLR